MLLLQMDLFYLKADIIYDDDISINYGIAHEQNRCLQLNLGISYKCYIFFSQRIIFYFSISIYMHRYMYVLPYID